VTRSLRQEGLLPIKVWKTRRCQKIPWTFGHSFGRKDRMMKTTKCLNCLALNRCGLQPTLVQINPSSILQYGGSVSLSSAAPCTARHTWVK